MPITLPIQKMTRADKLRAMETLWADLSKDEAKVAAHQWHENALHEAEMRVKAGDAVFSDWEAAKHRILRRAASKGR